MLNKVCAHCQQTYRIQDVRIDAHWNSWTLEPAYCHCPHCDSILPDVRPDTVDLAKHLKPTYILAAIGFCTFLCIGAVTHKYNYITPLLILLLGTWLIKSAQLRDHRIIGGILIGLSFAIFLLANYAN